MTSTTVLFLPAGARRPSWATTETHDEGTAYWSRPSRTQHVRYRCGGEAFRVVALASSAEDDVTFEVGGQEVSLAEARRVAASLVELCDLVEGLQP